MEFVHGTVGTGCNSSSSSGGGSSAQGEECMADLRRGPWTVDEDLILVNYIGNHGEGRWNSLARCAGLKRTGKSCRLRWLNYLRPDVRRGNITLEEQLLILQLHSRWGNRWSKIAQHLPGRTDNEIKNYWRTRVQKHAKQLKCDVNSQRFKDVMQHLWMPRLIERIRANSGTSTAPPTTTATAVSHQYDDTTIPMVAVPDQQVNDFIQVKVSPESSMDSIGTTSRLSSSPPMSDFTSSTGCWYDVAGGGTAGSHMVNWSSDEIPAAVGLNDFNRGLFDLDDEWVCGDMTKIAENFWSSMDDIWSLQQEPLPSYTMK